MKWLVVHVSFSTVALFCNICLRLLPLPYLSVEFKTHKAGGLIQFQESFAPTVSSNVPSLYSGQKWDDNREVGRLGLGVQVNQVQSLPSSIPMVYDFGEGESKN